MVATMVPHDKVDLRLFVELEPGDGVQWLFGVVGVHIDSRIFWLRPASAGAELNACTIRRRLQAVLDSGPPTTLL